MIELALRNTTLLSLFMLLNNTMTKKTQEKIIEVEHLLVDTVKVTCTGGSMLDEYQNANAQVHDGALFVRYMTDDIYYTKIYAKGTWADVVSSLPKKQLIAMIENHSTQNKS